MKEMRRPRTSKISSSTIKISDYYRQRCICQTPYTCQQDHDISSGSSHAETCKLTLELLVTDCCAWRLITFCRLSAAVSVVLSSVERKKRQGTALQAKSTAARIVLGTDRSFVNACIQHTQAVLLWTKLHTSLLRRFGTDRSIR